MNLWKSVAILAFIALVHGCSSQSLTSKINSTPEAAIDSLLESAKTNKMETARSLCHSSFLEELDTQGGFHEFFAEGHAKLQELEKYTVTSLARSDNKAKFKVHYTFVDGKREYDIISLKQDHNAWLITDM
ncbi:MAG: hypothetical protein ISS70_27150 [Phycisphaerae bacterium]|nr:hypothetical protein [Phycisphaerae bacterium]